MQSRLRTLSRFGFRCGFHLFLGVFLEDLLVGVVFHVPGDVDDEDSLVAFDEEHELEEVGALIV